MFFLQYEATPKRGTRDDREHIAGAVVNCWIRRKSLEDAKHVAVEWIARAGYITGDPDEADEVRHDELQSEQAKEYYSQALIDGEVFVFYTWPVEERR